MSRPIRVLVADDHTLFRSGLLSLLSTEPDIEVVGQASNGEEAVRLATDFEPDIVLMDIRMAGAGGIVATREIASELGSPRVIMLTFSEETDDLFNAIRSGARGYVLKNADAEELLGAIRKVHGGEGYLAPAVTLRMFDIVREGAFAPAGRPLTAREREVLSHIANGLTNRAIADKLVVSENTVKTHVRNILDKLDLNSRNEIIAGFQGQSQDG